MPARTAPVAAPTFTPTSAFVFGTAFFPVGAGLWRPELGLSERPIAFVAHVFDDASYRFALGPGCGDERIAGNRTWLGLRRVLALAEVPIEACFLTNALVGVKVGAATGAVRAGTRYRAQCAAYLRRQIEIVRPRLVVTLGSHAMVLARDALPALDRAWGAATTLTALDRMEPPRHVVRGVAVAANLAVDVAALRHPCTWTNAPRAGCDGRGPFADADILRRAATRR
ncbi:MAG: hypothetical protein NVS2B3_19820 [Vulcanimicrobiaceae bacterium]